MKSTAWLLCKLLLCMGLMLVMLGAGNVGLVLLGLTPVVLFLRFIWSRP